MSAALLGLVPVCMAQLGSAWHAPCPWLRLQGQGARCTLVLRLHSEMSIPTSVEPLHLPKRSPSPPAVVDDVLKQREPLTTLSGVYFVAPTPEAVARIIEDFGHLAQAAVPRSATSFFSSLPPELLQHCVAAQAC